MRKLLSLLGMCVLSIGAAQASTSTAKVAMCSSEQFGQHTISFEASTVLLHGERYELRTTQKMTNGTNLYIFSTNSPKPLLLGMNPQSNGDTLYMVSDMQKNTLDRGLCK